MHTQRMARDSKNINGAEAPFRAVGRRKAWEEVADQIRERIFAQHFRVTERLPTERELAAQFGVSRVVVREAIRSLELNGLLAVKKGAKGGIFVAQDWDRPVSDFIGNLLAGGGASLEHLFEIRRLIEPFAAARAAEHGSDEDFERLAATIAQAEEAHSKDGKNARASNLEFHRQMIRLAGNPILSIVGETVLLLLEDRIKHVTSPETSEAVVPAHKKILAALRRRQPENARKLMASDINAVGERLARLNGTTGTRKSGK